MFTISDPRFSLLVLCLFRKIVSRPDEKGKVSRKHEALLGSSHLVECFLFYLCRKQTLPCKSVGGKGHLYRTRKTHKKNRDKFSFSRLFYGLCHNSVIPSSSSHYTSKIRTGSYYFIVLPCPFPPEILYVSTLPYQHLSTTETSVTRSQGH